MKLSFVRLVLGPMGNNVYLLADEDSKDSVLIDSSFNYEHVLHEIKRQGWNLRQIWLTHAHFDHTAGVKQIWEALLPKPLIGMHPNAFAWAANQEEVLQLNFPIDPIPQVDISFFQGQTLSLDPEGGEAVVEVREVPGHNPGSVIFYCKKLQVAFCGDAIFRESIGRTDLDGGDYPTLIKSLHEQVLTLPDTTTLLPGHGPESSVGYEKRFNPYLA